MPVIIGLLLVGWRHSAACLTRLLTSGCMDHVFRACPGMPVQCSSCTQRGSTDGAQRVEICMWSSFCACALVSACSEARLAESEVPGDAGPRIHGRWLP